VVLLLVILQVVSGVVAVGTAWLIIRHSGRQDRERRWTGERWVTVADEAQEWLRRGDPGPLNGT
jgi:hypothetical protein